jgi:Fe-S cluster assembly iron-binding protein IscA
MLQMTDRAVTLLRSLRQQADLPDSTGVRVYSEADDSGQRMLSIGFTPEPAPTDEVGEHDGLRLFVASDVASPLSEAVMDVTGDNGDSQLIFRPAAENEDGGGTAPTT